ncbi:MAG: type II toxin-antitoxin system HicA family toxin [Nitrosopumilaceae archaeon]
MTKLPRITGNQMIKYLVNKKGFTKTAQKGSHVSLRSNDRWTTVPAKNEALGPGLILTILDDAGIGRDDFIHDWQNGLIK